MKTNEKFTKRLRNALISKYPNKAFYVSEGDFIENCRIYLIKRYEKKFLWLFNKTRFKRIYLGEVGAAADMFEIKLEIENKGLLRVLEDAGYEYFGDDVVWIDQKAYQSTKKRNTRQMYMTAQGKVAIRNDEPEDFNIKGAL